MKDIHQQIFQEYSHDFIGLPYFSFDCYDVVKLFYLKFFEISLDHHSYPDPMDKSNTSKIIASQKSKFEQVSTPEFGDIVLLRVHGLPSHLGIYLWDDKFMHTTEKTGCIIDSLNQWKQRVEGFYKYGQGKIK